MSMPRYFFECENEAAGYGLIAKTYSQEAGGMVWWIEEVCAGSVSFQRDRRNFLHILIR